MLGVVFTEFLDHVEEKFGLDVVDRIIDESDLPSGAAYTTATSYDFSEMVALVSSLSSVSGYEKSHLIKDFGVALGKRFGTKYKILFDAYPTFFAFINAVDSHIHAEVQRWHPNANLPTIQLIQHDDRTGKVIYRSRHCLQDLAAGIMIAVADYYGDKLDIETSNGTDERGSFINFNVRRTHIE